MTTGFYELLLTAPDGRTRRTLAWLPTEQVRQEYFTKARKRGLTIEIINENENQNEYDKRTD